MSRDAENFYKRDIYYIRMFSFVLTYKVELTLMVGKSCLATLGSANSFGIRVSALTSNGRSVCSFGSTGGGYCEWPLCIKTDRLYYAGYQTGNLKSSLSDNRPEAFAASFQTSEGEHQHAFLRKDRFEVRDKRYEGDAEDYYKGILYP